MERKRHQFTPEELDGPKGPSGYPLTEPPRRQDIPYVHQDAGEGAAARFKSFLRYKRHLQKAGQIRTH
ncbi:MAG: hypothetical protein COU25_02945 [Candidatus Levybacteria bacterium CG10_big_fil_rev_8_21_14_0_10_35_13]|nr:MAG: hypothetical protein COU25_02945 [Candidatus Levybacteria bacterium CG10_big_fil_rev_8_21_14_0_10_35_13]